MFENRVLRRIVQSTRDELTGKWRKLDTVNLYSSLNTIRVIKPRRMTWPGHAARMGESRCVYRILMGKPEGKRPLGRPMLRWEDNMKMYLQEVGWDV